MEIIEQRNLTRPRGRPRLTATGIRDRLERYKLMEKCAEFTDEAIAIWKEMARSKKCPYVLRLAAIDRLMDRAYGLPIRPMQVDTMNTDVELKKVIHQIRWLPPDPADTSRYIAPEPD